VAGVVLLDLGDRRHLYWLVLAVVAVGYALAHRVVISPFGTALVAIRESEARAAAIGIDVDRHRHLALVMSGSLSGLAGALFAFHQNFVSPELLFVALSGEVVVITMLGGLGTLYGSIAGAVLAVGIKELLSTWTDNWLVVLGGLYVLCVMCFPQGLVRLVERGARPARASSEAGA
jgi:branched-chain amino acid transport system permease protein